MDEALANAKPVPIGRLMRIERLVLGKLRDCVRGGADGKELSTPPLSPLAELVVRAKASGFELCRAEATFVAPAELRLLSLLAIAQRMAFDVQQLEPVLAEALLSASLALQREGLRLGLGTVARVQPDAFLACSRDKKDGRNSLRMRALRYVRERGTLSPQGFLSIGISRQYLSKLCSRGDFVRIRPALYRAA